MPSIAKDDAVSRDAFALIDAYESAYARGEANDIASYLPKRDDANYIAVLCELVRIDLEHGWQRGTPKSIAEYNELFPDLCNDLQLLGNVAFEEYRLRHHAGQRPTPDEYAVRFGVDTSNWFGDAPADGAGRANGVSTKDALPAHTLSPKTNPLNVSEAAFAFDQFCYHFSESAAGRGSWCASLVSPAEERQFIQDAATSAPELVDRVGRALHRMPEVGTEFCGFQLVDELGRGAFSRVFLASQVQLAHRLVALKVSTQFLGESQTLAQLQHTNIVPIYSVHQSDDFHALCMPYFGSVTLADILENIQASGATPHSGKGLLETIHGRGKTTHRVRPSSNLPPEDEVLAESPAESAKTASLETLQSLSYVEAVLWVFSRLAQGLAHAHERGVLHRDLKPANILLRDDGEPMLLDFNLSEDTKRESSASAAAIGGTLPYMAPEHLSAFQGQTTAVDVRADVYSLGIILFELLAGCPPFPPPRRATPAAIERMVQDRMAGAPSVRRYNRELTAAIEAIVQRCLAPEPEARYQSAWELHEDLECQLTHHPLKHSREPSLLERFRKWVRRHPRATSSTTILLAASAMILLLIGMLSLARQEVVRHRAIETLEEFETEKAEAQFHLVIREPSDKHVDAGLAAAQRCLTRYEVLANPEWYAAPRVQRLSSEERQRLQADVSELLQLMSWAKTLLADAAQTSAEGSRLLKEAWEYHRLAERCNRDVSPPRALLIQRANLLRRQGDADEAQQAAERAETLPLTSARDRYLIARDHFVHERFSEAAAMLKQALTIDRRNFRYWFLLGRCCDSSARNLDATVCYTACSVLRPDFVWSYFNLGLAHYRQRNYDEALAAFDQAVEMNPQSSETYINRALVKYKRKDYPSAIADLTTALDLGAGQTRIYFLRSRLREQTGDVEGSRSDFQEGLSRKPTDELSWISRGIARIANDPQGALNDFDCAIALNSQSRAGLQNKARVLSEYLGKTDEAIYVLDQLLRLYPGYVRGRGGRGVLLARLGRRESALADAQICLQQDGNPEVVYQVACIFALTSREESVDRDEALRHLSDALRRGFGRDLFEQDADLEPIRNDVRFQRLIKLSRSRKRSAQPRPEHKP